MFRWILTALAVLALSLAISLSYRLLAETSHLPPPVVARAPGAHQGDFQDYEPVSLVRLLASPDQYDGRKVLVEGYVTLHFEGAGVHLDKASFEAGLRKNAVWLDPPRWLNPDDERKLTRNYAQVTGVFRASEHGHLGLYSGTLTEVRSIDKLLSNADYERWRLGWTQDAVLSTMLSPWFLALAGWVGMAIFWLRSRLLK